MKAEKKKNKIINSYEEFCREFYKGASAKSEKWPRDPQDYGIKLAQESLEKIKRSLLSK